MRRPASAMRILTPKLYYCTDLRTFPLNSREGQTERVKQATLCNLNSVIGALGRMYTTGALTDVTLSANGTTLKAHRLVLASCSQYFAQLFKEVEGESNTLVVVLGCDAVELRLLLSFMYWGEVTASRRNLPALLRLARALKVAGLTLNPDSQSETESRHEEQAESNSPVNLEINKNSTQHVDSFSSLDNNGNDFRFNFDESNENKETPHEDNRNDERLSRLDQIVQNLYSTHKIDSPTTLPVTPPIMSSLDDPQIPCDRKYRHSTCTICMKRLSNQYNLRVHMETHSGGRHACRACAHVSRSRDALRKHVAYRHPDIAGLRRRDV